jgi:fructose-1,6-bisphosphatase
MKILDAVRDEKPKANRPDPMALYERIFSLRHAAKSLYDRGRAVDKKPEEIQQEIEPLQKALEHSIKRAARNDLPGCVLAVRQLETVARGHMSDADFLLDKANACREHAEHIKNEVMAEMKKDGITERRVGDFSLVITPIDGRDVLSLR